MTEGRRLFDEFLKKGQLQDRVVATALGVSKATVNNWRNGHAPVEHICRLAIEILTEGAVPAVSWATEAEKTFIEKLVPIRIESPRERGPTKAAA